MVYLAQAISRLVANVLLSIQGVRFGHANRSKPDRSLRIEQGPNREYSFTEGACGCHHVILRRVILLSSAYVTTAQTLNPISSIHL